MTAPAIQANLANITSVGSLASGEQQLLPANGNRAGAVIYNESTAILYLAFGPAASLTAYTVQIPANGYFELPGPAIYTGVISGIWSAANGFARITELS